MKKILSYLKPFARFMWFSLSVKMIATLLELALPYILSHIIDDVIKPLEKVPEFDMRAKTVEIVVWAAIMIVCAFLAVAGNVWANRMAAKIAKDVARDVRHDLFERTMRLSPAQTDAFTVPSLESRMTTDTYNIHNFINTMQRMGIRAPILLVGGLAVTATLDPVLTLVMACVLPLIFIVFYGLTARGLPLYTKIQEAVDRMIRVVREDSQGIYVIKALSKTEHENDRYDEVNKGLARIEGKTNTIMSSASPIMNFFMNAGLVAVIFAGAYRVNNNLTEPGKIVAFIQYFTLISIAMISVTRIFVIWSKAGASSRRIVEVLETPEGLPVADESVFPPANETGITFDHVSFSYNKPKNDPDSADFTSDEEKDVLHDVSFHVRKGGRLGIIGSTGSGKTTIVSLLMRFYDVEKGRGSIRINGRDVRTIPEHELHSMFGVAMQNDFIMADTVEENISFGRDLPHEAVVRAAEIAQADGFIRSFANGDDVKDGYDYMLAAKGENLSGGQRQRILISRAIAGDPDILILDDSSSALDYKTDSELRRDISEKLAGTTSVIVAQRVSSVMSSDLIIVLEEGRVIGMGTHDELLENCDVYREISNSQMGGAFVE